MDGTTGLPYPEWQRALQEAMLEFDGNKLTERVLNAEALIVERLRQLQESKDGRNEREAIDDGLFILRTLKREKLRYPDPT